MVCKEELMELIRKHPLLCNYGYGLGDEALGLTREERRALFERQQRELLENLGQVERAVKWWRGKGKTKTCFGQKEDSYALKHLAEPEIGYTTNGAFIAAALLCGFVIEPGRIGGRNVFFNVSQKGLHDRGRESSGSCPGPLSSAHERV